MAWNSFKGIAALIPAALSGSSALNAFCASNYGKGLTVRMGLKRREEIVITELPVMMVTIPEQKTAYGVGGLVERVYTVRLYCGFQQDDRVKAQDNLIDIEELMEQALLNDAALGAADIIVEPGSSVNDEGSLHPVYFLLKDLLINTEQRI
ncbi:MAG: hypothetical protein ACE5GY_09820 [Thermodesulfobacteriota bacterium]